MNTKHSPGPWEIHGDPTAGAYYVHAANKICDIAKPQGFYRSPAETEANARLIKAAPKLYAALTQAMMLLREEASKDDPMEPFAYDKRWEDCAIAADAAIAEATS